jgi:hypothetical protein
MRSLCCLCVYVSLYPPIVAMQRLGGNVTAVMNTHTKIEELLDASFSMWPVSYQGNCAISSSQNFLFVIVLMFLFPDELERIWKETVMV